MSYKEKPQLKLFAFENNAFVLKAIVDDYQEVSIERNLYEAGAFTITINYNIPNALKFQRGLFIQFGDDSYDFGEIITVSDTIGEEGKGSQIRTIVGYDARYILKRRVIKNTNSNGLWVMTAKGELCLRNLIKDQCGSGAEAKRQLPIENVIPQEADAIGKVYSVSEQFTNLYEVCKTIATQTEIGWRMKFVNGTLILECYNGADKSQTVRFDTSYDSLSNGEFSDSSDSFSNAVYVGGKGQNDDRDIYEGENGTPSGFDRFESWDNQSQMTVESEYEAEALSMLTQYGQTVLMSGNGLAKSPYVYKEQYNVGDWITVAFSGKSAVVQILSVTEHWAWGSYDIQFSFGKPQPNLAEQLQLMLRKIQSASNKTNSTDSVRWYTIPTDTEMPKADVTYNTIGFIGTCAEGGSTFKLYLDDEKTGAKTYHIYFKQLGGGNLTLTTGKDGATDLVMNSGTYVAIIYVDENGNVSSQSASAVSEISAGNFQPVTSNAVATSNAMPVDAVTSGNMHSVTSNAVAEKTNSILGGIVATDINLNNYLTCGLYVSDEDRTYINAPSQLSYAAYFGLWVIRTASYQADSSQDEFRNQILFHYQTGDIYSRSYHYTSGGSMIWSAWQKLVTETNLTNVLFNYRADIGTWFTNSVDIKYAIDVSFTNASDYTLFSGATDAGVECGWYGFKHNNTKGGICIIMSKDYGIFLGYGSGNPSTWIYKCILKTNA